VKVVKNFSMGLDYSKQNLRGKSFIGRDLTGANFSDADIRGSDFTNATLKDANFSGATAGSQRCSTYWLLLASYLLALLTAFLCLATSRNNFILAAIPSFPLIAGLAIVLFWGLEKKWEAGILYLLIFGIIFWFFAGFGIGTSLIFALGSILVAFPFAAAGIEIGRLGLVIYTVPLTFLLTIILVFHKVDYDFWFSNLVAILFGLSIGIYILSLGKKHFPPNYKAASILAAARGTSFRSANLTGANFRRTMLNSTDFRKATITNVDWSDAIGLGLARFGGTNLQNSLVQEIVTSRELAKSGNNEKIYSNDRIKNYDGVDFEGINLEGVNLKGASLIRANLNYANLRNANLTGAILKQAQLDGADLTGAILTGAFIECWGRVSASQTLLTCSF
jgi:uncharacterized protein YjbI with pentapeptide repeats